MKRNDASAGIPSSGATTASGAVQHYWWLIAVAVLGLVLGIRMALSSESGRWQWDQLVLRLPLLGEVVLKTETARFARILGTLLKSGVPVLTALGVVRELSGNQVLGRAIERVGDGVRRGAGISGPLNESQAFPAMAVHIVRVGEETGRLDTMFVRMADIYETDTRASIKRFTAIFEPVVILVMGLLIGSLILSMLLAITSINDVAV